MSSVSEPEHEFNIAYSPLQCKHPCDRPRARAHRAAPPAGSPPSPVVVAAVDVGKLVGNAMPVPVLVLPVPALPIGTPPVPSAVAAIFVVPTGAVPVASLAVAGLCSPPPVVCPGPTAPPPPASEFVDCAGSELFDLPTVPPTAPPTTAATMATPPTRKMMSHLRVLYHGVGGATLA